MNQLQKRSYGYVHVPKKKPPHLLGFGSEWRKCFVVHPHSQGTRPFESFQVLTGSIIEHSLPPELLTVQYDSSELGMYEERLKTAMSENSQKWGRGKKKVDKLYNVLSSALFGVWMSGADHLQTGSLTMEPRIESYWRCEGFNFLCVPEPLFILNCTKPLSLFSNPSISHNHLTMSLDNPRHLGLFEHSFDQITPFAGCHRYSPTGFGHTIFAADLQTRSRDQTLANGLMNLFSVCAAECVQNGYPLDSHLSQPLSLLGVMATDDQLTFLAFQLNTLDLRRGQDNGLKNILWAGPTLNLMSGGTVNRECSQLLWQYLMFSPTRERPRISGFQLK